MIFPIIFLLSPFGISLDRTCFRFISSRKIATVIKSRRNATSALAGKTTTAVTKRTTYVTTIQENEVIDSNLSEFTLIPVDFIVCSIYTPAFFSF